MAVGQAVTLFDASGIPTDANDSGVLVIASLKGDATKRLVGALARHRHVERETDPPRV